MLDLLFLYPLVLVCELFRVFLTGREAFYILINLPWMQRPLRRTGIIRAYRVYNKARRKCPAYRDFLKLHRTPRLLFGQSLSRLPGTDKENYVKKYSVEERCYGGQIPLKGVVIDESSGSSGTPNNWVRGPEDRSDIRKLLQFSFSITYPRQDIFLINCFALGPWATGMNVSMSLVDVAILKSIGPDTAKLENTLKLFGPRYHYLVAGYPPFIKLFLDETRMDLSPYQIHLVTGGEGMSEGLRNHFSKAFKTVLSSYGASDLDINLGVETEFTVRLRSLCSSRPELARRLFGQERVPMIFQYNPLDYYVEISPLGELVFTVCRFLSAAPKVRYNLKDMGGVLTMARVMEILGEEKIDPAGFSRRRSWLPLLYVYGRGDLAVAFYGCKVFSSDIDSILNGNPELSAEFNSFKIAALEDEKLEHHLKIMLEKKPGSPRGVSEDPEKLRKLLFEELKSINQDFREVSKMFTWKKILVEVYDSKTGPFKDRDIRVKLDYVDKKTN
jgi:phenylacetate-CoA ligase